MKSAKLAALLLVSLTAVACGDSDTDDAGAGASSSKGGGGDGTIQPGKYELTTDIDLTNVDGWNDSVGDTLKPVQKLTENPAQAFIDDLGASSPIVAALKDKVPDLVESKVVGWINDKVDTASGLTGLLSSLQTMLGKFQILSTLDLADGNTNHTVTGIALHQGSEHVLVDAPDLLDAIKPAENVLVKLKGAEATFGGHALSLPIGDIGSKGLDLLDTDKLAKTGLKFLLTRIVKCDDIADTVASKCVGPICVGHSNEIEQLCDKGLDAVVNLTLSGMKKLKINPLKLVGGNAKLVDALIPGDAGAISGIWKGAVDLGKGERAITSVFKGRKL